MRIPSKAIYGQGTYQIDKFKFTVGLRNSWDNRAANAYPPNTDDADP